LTRISGVAPLTHSAREAFHDLQAEEGHLVPGSWNKVPFSVIDEVLATR
jgi:hypothetical protein